MKANKIREIRIIRENPRFRRYPEYKESGVEFIGEVPAHWEAKRLGHVSTIFKGGTPKRNVDRYFQGDLPWARPVDITALKGALYIHDTEMHISEEALGNSGARRLPAGTVLLTSRATIGETAITTVPMATNQGFANFVCDERLLNVYLVYYLRAIKDLLISLGSGSTFLEVTKGTLVGVRILLPSLSEQTQIANFLDRKTGQIDELIRIKERQIELLQEQRTALINQAVTKGLDPNVEMKPSGVAWIGEIPAQWKILPFRHCLKKVKTKKKGSIPKVDYQESGEFPVIDQGASFIAGWTDLIDSVIFDNLPIVIFGDHTRIFKYVDFPFALGADGTQLLYPNDDILNPRFFYYALLNLTIPNEGYSRHYRYLREFSVACPVLSGQRQIADLLDRKTQQIDELIATEQRKIELLKEYRQSLISEAVTGKIDIRNEV